VVREFGEAEISPVVREHDEANRYPEDVGRRAADLDFVPRTARPTTATSAWMSSAAPSLPRSCAADPGIGSAVGSAGFGSSMLLAYGAEWMNEEWLPRIASGESASYFSEPGHGADVAGMKTTAGNDGDEYVIEGRKM